MAFGINHDIGRFDITVDNLLSMSIIQSLCYLAHHMIDSAKRHQTFARQ